VEHPKDIGDRSTLAIILSLRSVGYGVLLPFGENTRYDLVIEEGGSFSRVQCKTGRLREGSIRFPVCSCYGHHRNPVTARRSYHGQIDSFAVFCPETGGVYLIHGREASCAESGALTCGPAPEQSTKASPLRGGLRDRSNCHGTASEAT
jgi:hypothetical protein